MIQQRESSLLQSPAHQVICEMQSLQRCSVLGAAMRLRNLVIEEREFEKNQCSTAGALEALFTFGGTIASAMLKCIKQYLVDMIDVTPQVTLVWPCAPYAIRTAS